MTAHISITPAQAIAMLEAVGIADPRRLIADRTAAGLVKSYALVIETAEVGGLRSSVRGAAVACELWRRMISECATDDVWGGGTVRLKAAELVGGAPEVHITGITFHPAHVQHLADQQRPGSASSRHSKRVEVSPPNDRGANHDAALELAPIVKRRVPDLSPLHSGALLLTVDQAGAALAKGRTSIYKMIGGGKLVRPDGETRVTAESVRRCAGLID